MDRRDYQSNIYNLLHSYCENANDIVRNPLMLGKRKRELKITIPDVLRPYNVEDELSCKLERFRNAQAEAKYESDFDHIIIHPLLFEMCNNILTHNCEGDADRLLWMQMVSQFFCAFHELGHLYCGHCQIISPKCISLYASPQETGLSSDDIYVMEVEADSFASCRVAEKMCGLIFDKSYKETLEYSSPDVFYEDAIKGMCSFFFVLGFLELSESVRLHELELAGKHEERVKSHPPALERCFYSGLRFISHVEHYFGLPSKLDYFCHIFFHIDEIFSNKGLAKDKYEMQYRRFF